MNPAIPLIIIACIGFYMWTNPGVPSITMVYSHSCGACSAVLPNFKKLTIPGVYVNWVDSKHSTFGNRYVPAFFYSDRSGNTEEYKGPRDNASITAYVQSKIIPTA